jgi:hypothetical protein
MTAQESAEGAPTRNAEDDDHDLLTYSEVGVRLHEEVLAQRRRVAELERSQAEGLLPARDRLAALEAALERNTQQPINDDNFERFFGYKGTARRNT